MYLKHCRLTRFQQLRLLEYFVAGTSARTAGDLVGIHRNSAIRFFHKLRQKIACKQAKRAVRFCGEVEVDESYFGGHSKGKRGRGRKSHRIWPFKTWWQSLHGICFQRAEKTPIARNSAENKARGLYRRTYSL
uniref:Transposase n=1 Tax=uncultured organism TaxID=155900 RepID=E3T2Z6_9ZZZZ|nr:transposase [uncultured organism]